MQRNRFRKPTVLDITLLVIVIGVVIYALIPGGYDQLFPKPSSDKAHPSGSVPYFPGDEGKSAEDLLQTAPKTPLIRAIADLPTGSWERKTRYHRDQFGQRWADVDHNGCDTRNDILRRDLKNTHLIRGCLVASGEFTDPYTGKHIHFQRGEHSSAAVQIDHVVALSNAWKTGAQNWDITRREQFANSPGNLLAVDGLANQDKGDKDAAHWLPVNQGFRCQYVASQVAVKRKWHLWVTEEEKKTMIQVASSCPQQKLPTV